MGMHDSNTVPTEWVFKGGRNGDETAIIRRIDFGSNQNPTIWYRVVTYSPSSAERQLIGWCKTMDAAQSVAWDYSCAIDSWMHAQAATRRDHYTPPADPAELVRAYRDAKREHEKKPPSTS